jgi:hypothetical protein
MKWNKLEFMDTKFLENSAACCLGYYLCSLNWRDYLLSCGRTAMKMAEAAIAYCIPVFSRS